MLPYGNILIAWWHKWLNYILFLCDNSSCWLLQSYLFIYLFTVKCKHCSLYVMVTWSNSTLNSTKRQVKTVVFQTVTKGDRQFVGIVNSSRVVNMYRLKVMILWHRHRMFWIDDVFTVVIQQSTEHCYRQVCSCCLAFLLVCNKGKSFCFLLHYLKYFFSALVGCQEGQWVWKIVKHDSWSIQPDILNPLLLRLTSRKPLCLYLQPVDIKSRWRHNWKSP